MLHRTAAQAGKEPAPMLTAIHIGKNGAGWARHASRARTAECLAVPCCVLPTRDLGDGWRRMVVEHGPAVPAVVHGAGGKDQAAQAGGWLPRCWQHQLQPDGCRESRSIRLPRGSLLSPFPGLGTLLSSCPVAPSKRPYLAVSSFASKVALPMVSWQTKSGRNEN